MRIRRWLSAVLSAAMVVTAAAPCTVRAAMLEDMEQRAAEVQNTEEFSGAFFADLPDNDALFAGYAEQVLYGEHSAAALGEIGAERLEGVDLKAYTALKEQLKKIASGELADTRIALSLEDLGIEKTSCTASELGVDKIVEGNTITQEAMDAWMQQNMPDIHRVLGYLMADCPMELYWFDKTTGVSVNGPEMGAASSGGAEWVLSIKTGAVYQFRVAADYRDPAAEDAEYTINASQAVLVRQAADNAREIVSRYAGYGDLEKLAAYRQEICDLASYHYEAAGSGTAYGNPWQLVWVFDKDDATAVVCEGYAKAFQYLCDLSEFEHPNTRCYTVTGEMSGGTGAGGHMWNIVTMDDGKSYIADITNCDTDTIGADDKLFLAAAAGSAESGYSVEISGQRVNYVYDGDMPGMYGDILRISGEDYDPGWAEDRYLARGTYGDDGLAWELDREGTFQIRGTGAMPDADKFAAVPWDPYRSQIKKAVVGEGITNIGAMAFYNCENMTEISLPDSIERLGPIAFSRCKSLTGVELGERLTYVGDLAFMSCVSLTELSFPQTLTYIGNEVFYDCKGLKDIWFAGECPVFVNHKAFNRTALTVHYQAIYKEGWEKLQDSWTGEEDVVWRAYCKEHTWESGYRVDKEASCTTAGSRSIHCTVCGEIRDSQVIPASGHKYAQLLTRATISQNGGIVQKCQVCGDISSASVIYSPNTVSLSKTSYTYNGKECRPAVTVTDVRGAVIPAENYLVSYENSQAVGTAFVHITFQGNYSGMLTEAYTIQPKGTSVSKLTAQKKGFTVKWKKQASQTNGYQIQYAVNKKFKGAKNVQASKNKTKVKISKLKAKKRYFVRIRTYKTVNGTRYYSAWSKSKQVTTK